VIAPKTGPKTPLDLVELEKLRRTSLSIRNRVADALLLKGDLVARRDGETLQLGPA
jgi:hypothetical protein